MSSSRDTSGETDLHQKAESILQGKAGSFSEQLKALSPEALAELLHELHVYQIELELQNEELRQTQIELDIAKTRYFKLYDLAPVAYLTITNKGLIKQTNLAAATLLGISQRKLLNQPFSKFILNADLAHYYPFYKLLVNSGEQQVLDVRMLRNDGSQFWAHLEAIVAMDEGDSPILQITLSDVTKLILTEIALRESAVYAQSLVDSALDGVICIDQDGRIISWNPQAAHIFGYSIQEASDRDFLDFIILHEHQKDFRHSLVEYKNTGFSSIINSRIEVKGLRSDETEFPMELSISVVEQHESYFFSIYVRDITERKKADDFEQFRSRILEQLTSNTPLNTILESLALGVEQIYSPILCSILLLDADGNRFLKGIAPSLPDFYNEAINGLEIGFGVGSCGTAAFTGKPVMVEDIAAHPYFAPIKELVASAGLRASWSQPIFSSHNQVLGTFAIYHRTKHKPTASDIRLIEQVARLASLAIERKQNENELRIAATAFESQEGIIVTDANKTILRVNSAFTTITGYLAEDVVGKTPRVLQSGKQDSAFYAAMWKSIHKTGAWQGEIWNRRKNGEVFLEQLAITAVKDPNGIVSNYVATLTDITLRKEALDKIQRLAFYDSLTGLPNRQLLQDRLTSALTSSHRLGLQGALLFIDMDNFKTLNDTLGHDMGDLLLQQVAQRLESCVRRRDTVARLGGDEFVVMLENLSEYTLDTATQTKIIGDKIMAILNQPYQLNGHNYYSTPSIGVTLFTGQKQSCEELLKQADIAMYQAKNLGRNAVCFFDPKMQTSINARAVLEENLRLAIKEQQFVIYFQPQVQHNGKIIGAEVLIRWQHPENGLVSPLEFIPLAEETRLILPIGEWTLKAACSQLKIWEGSEYTRSLQLAVNVSARQFHQTDFIEQVCQTLGFYGINPGMLKLELTETIVLDDIEDTIFKMNALRKIGVQFSMDDFGTGYSSLSSLKKLPLDQLKIDQSFIRDLSIDVDYAIIVESVIAMANKLNIEVIAEGVETEAQRKFLELNGCQLYQGHLFSQPLPIDQFELLLKKN